MKNRSLHSQVAFWDVVIVGGGPAGAATAITLAQAGRRILLLEKQSSLGFKLGESLPPIAIGIVEHYLGAVSEFSLTQSGVTKTAGNVSVWENDIPDISDFFYSAPGFGLCLDRANFDIALRNKAVQVGVTLKQHAQFKRCQRATQNQHINWNIEVATASGFEWHDCRYLVDCSGRQSVVANSLGTTRICNDRLFAFAQRFITHNPDKDRFTRLEAGAQGWWYSNRLPLNNSESDKNTTQRLVVFHTDKDLGVAKLASEPSGFAALLAETRHISNILHNNGYSPEGKIRGASAASERLREFAGDAWLAVGDAAQAYDPLSSQGIYKALSTGNTAGQLIHYALTENDKKHNNNAAVLNANNIHIKRYIEEQEQLWAKYLKQHDYYYLSQPRWSDQSFWSRRRLNMVSVSRHQHVRDAQ